MTGITICCDHCGVELPGVYDTKAVADARATKLGWTLRKIGKKKYFFCQLHAEAAPDQKVMQKVMDRYGCAVTKALNA